jgi:microsomal dipeptidase-like Zn-dependent dipeptidase
MACGVGRATGALIPVAIFATLIVAIALCLQATSAHASDAGGHVPSAADRYRLANGCFTLRSLHTGDLVAKSGGGYSATAATGAAAEPFRMQATDLGRYLFYGPAPDFMARNGANQVVPAANPSDDSDWTVREERGGFRIVNEFAARDLAVGAGDALVTVAEGGGGAAGRFDFEPATGCADYPEIEVNVSGPLPSGGSPDAPVRGLIETHMHQMAYEFLSTKAHCGRPWHRFGAPFALQDCPDHALTGGCTAILETALSGTTCHGAGGWPDFGGWPDHRQLTHEQSYYKWVERSWRTGLRIFVNLAVENRVLCELYRVYALVPLQNCDEMATVRRELQRMRELERYVDAQNGGPGEGWYRLVGSPAEARRVIAEGKLAVVPGMEVSEPFGCRLMQPGDMPLCSEQQVRDGIDELYDLGVRQLELVNKFDNALTGVAGDSDTTGTITNLGNFYSAGTFWDLEGCEGDNPEVNHDHSPTALSHNDDELIANGLDALGDTTGITPPVYGSPPHCNQRGLTSLGRVAIERIMEKGMLFDPDHMSVIARNSALDLVESRRYPGILTSHSWSTDNALPRISALGGLIGPAAKSPEGFVADWQHIKAHGYDQLNPHLFGFGYGADMNGFASQGGPPANPIAYPFQSPIDPTATVHRQRSGQRTFDINSDGTAHYGLYADWTEAVRVAGGQAIIDEMASGAEAYLQMWERAKRVRRPRGPR